jgi:hypothetical protein
MKHAERYSTSMTVHLPKLVSVSDPPEIWDWIWTNGKTQNT